MGNFDLGNYVEVNVRVEKFWELYPNGRIATEIISFKDGVIVMKASVYKAAENETPDATGHAYEKENSTFINKTSAVENCETSAIGRALGVMGFEIKKSIASREEVANAVLQQKVETDVELKKRLVKKHNGDKAAAKKEYDAIKSGAESEAELDADMDNYLKTKLEAVEV